MDHGVLQGVWVAYKGRCHATMQITSPMKIEIIIPYDPPVCLRFDCDQLKRGSRESKSIYGKRASTEDYILRGEDIKALGGFLTMIRRTVLESIPAAPTYSIVQTHPAGLCPPEVPVMRHHRLRHGSAYPRHHTWRPRWQYLLHR